MNNFNLEVLRDGLTKFQSTFLTSSFEEVGAMLEKGADISKPLPQDLNKRSCFFLMNREMFKELNPEQIQEKFEIFKLLFSSYSLSHIPENRNLKEIFEDDIEIPKAYFKSVGLELDKEFLKELKFKQRVYFADEEFEKFKVEGDDLGEEELSKAQELRKRVQAILGGKDPHAEHLRFHYERIKKRDFFDNYAKIDEENLSKIFTYEEDYLDPERLTLRLDQVGFGGNDSEFKRLFREYYLKLNSYNLLSLEKAEIIPSEPIKFPDGFQKNIFNTMIFLHDSAHFKEFSHLIYRLNQDDGKSSNIFDLLLSGVENYQNNPVEKIEIVCQLLINGAIHSHKKTEQQAQEIAEKLTEFVGNAVGGVDNVNFIRKYLQNLHEFGEKLESFSQLEIASEDSKAILQTIKEKTSNCIRQLDDEILSPRGLLTYIEYFGVYDFLLQHKHLEGYKEIYESINNLIDSIPSRLPIHEKKDKIDAEEEFKRKAEEIQKAHLDFKAREEEAKKAEEELLAMLSKDDEGKSKKTKRGVADVDNAQKEAEEKSRQEDAIRREEDKAQKEVEERAKREEAKIKREAEERAKQEEDRVKREEAKIKKEAEERAKQEAKAKREEKKARKKIESKAPLALAPTVSSPPKAPQISESFKNLMIMGEFHEAIRESDCKKIVGVVENHKAIAHQLFFREYSGEPIFHEIIKSSNSEFLKTFIDCSNSLSQETTFHNLLKLNKNNQNILHFFSRDSFGDLQRFSKLDLIASAIPEKYWSEMINSKDFRGFAPLDYAIKNGDINLALELTKKGAKLHLDNIQDTVLLKFFDNKNLEMMKSFYEEGLIKFTEIPEDALRNFKLLGASKNPPFSAFENPLAREFVNFINEKEGAEKAIKKAQEDQKKLAEAEKDGEKKARTRRGRRGRGGRVATDFQAIRVEDSEIESESPLPTPRNPTLVGVNGLHR